MIKRFFSLSLMIILALTAWGQSASRLGRVNYWDLTYSDETRTALADAARWNKNSPNYRYNQPLSNAAVKIGDTDLMPGLLFTVSNGNILSFGSSQLAISSLDGIKISLPELSAGNVVSITTSSTDSKYLTFESKTLDTHYIATTVPVAQTESQTYEYKISEGYGASDYVLIPNAKGAINISSIIIYADDTKASTSYDFTFSTIYTTINTNYNSGDYTWNWGNNGGYYPNTKYSSAQVLNVPFSLGSTDNGITELNGLTFITGSESNDNNKIRVNAQGSNNGLFLVCSKTNDVANLGIGKVCIPVKSGSTVKITSTRIIQKWDGSSTTGVTADNITSNVYSFNNCSNPFYFRCYDTKDATISNISVLFDYATITGGNSQSQGILTYDNGTLSIASSGNECFKNEDGTDVTNGFFCGSTITITANPNTGYTLTSLKGTYYQDADKTAEKLTISGEGNTRTFIMPTTGDVTITATFTSTATALTSDNVSVASVVYNGTEQTANVKYDGTTNLIEGTDYDVSEANSNKGTNADDYTFSITGTGNYTGTVSDLTFTINKANYTVEGESSATATQGTQVKNITISGLTVKDVSGNVVEGSWAFPNDNTTEPEVGNTIAYTATFTPSVADGNYNVLTKDIVPIITAAELPKAEVTTAPRSATGLTYTGTAQQLFVTTDAVASNGTLHYSKSQNGGYTEDATTITETDAGTYTIWYKAVGNGNYSDSDPVSIEVTIAKATLTATADNKSKMVGEDNPTLTVTVTGFVNGETADTADAYTAPTATTTADKDSEARTYDITVSGGAATNYSFTYVNGTLTVTAPVSDEYVSTTTSWVFNNLTTSTVYKSIANISNGIYVRGGESSGIANINRTFTVKDLASSQQVTFSDGYTVTISKYLETNGSFQNASSITTTTTAASTEMTTGNSSQLVGAGGMAFNTTVAGTLYVCMGLTETSTDDKKLRIYYNNGSAIASQTVNTKTTEIVEVKVTGAAGTYTFGCPDTKYRIYAVRFVPTSEAKAAWVYIGSTGYSTFGNTTGSNLDLPEGLTAYSVKPGSTSATLTALSGIPQTAGVVLKGTYDTNYALTTSATAYSAESNYMVRVTADNTTIPQTEEVNSSTRYNYILQEDADEAQFTKASGSSVLAKGKAYFRSNKDFGDNVGLTIAASQESINPSVSLIGWTYGEAANSPSVEGNTGDGTVTYTYYTDSNLSVPTTPENSGAASDGSQPVNAGTYYIKAEIAASGNYLAGTATASFTISKATLTATAADATRAVGEENPSFTVNVTGFVNGEDASKAAGYAAPTASTTADTNSEAGTYAITVSGGSATNYTFTYVDGTLTVGNASTYTITGVAEDEHGNKVEASPTSASAGAQIMLTITTATDYVLTSISAKDADNDNVELSGSDATRTFTMPAKNVIISATWTANTVQQTDTGDSKTQESYSITDANNAQVTTITATSGATSVTIPAAVNGVAVTSIADDAFSGIINKSDIKSIDLSATSITGVEVDRTSGVFNGFPEETMIYMPASNTAASREKNVIIDGICSDFVMTDTKSYKIPKAFKAASATVSRTFTNGKYCTLCLPYTIPSDNLSGKVYEFSGVNEETVTMTESNDGLQANKPYIFVPNANVNGMTVSDNSILISIDMSDSPHTVNSEADFTFKGVFENMDFSSDEISNGIYGFAAEANYGASIGQFVKAANGADIKGMRAYLAYNGILNGTNTAATRGMVLPEVLNIILVHANGSTTNIGRLEMMTTEDGSPVYNLNGLRVDNNYKGIVIKKGKKVVKK